ncbi:hypothetical protein D9M68_171480 [compost metagenome]
MKQLTAASLVVACTLAALMPRAWAQAPAGEPIPVTVDNFIEAESALYFAGAARDYGFGVIAHNRNPASLDNQTVIRLNRDTLYSGGVFDLEAGPVSLTLPGAGERFMSLQVISADHYVPAVHYEPGTYTFTREEIGTRYVLVVFRTLVDPSDPQDVKKVHALQDAIKAEQPGGPGKLELPNWDQASQKKVRGALLTLAATLPDTKKAFGRRGEVDPLRHLLGSASAWGGNPETEALYLNVVPSRNDGRTVHRLLVKDVPVDSFWSISLYNADGYYEKNEFGAYSLNNVTARKSADGSIAVQFGGCDGTTANCLPIMQGWNYMVRLYRPRPEILDGTWRFPEAQPVN